MSHTQISSCPHCGAPIYVPTIWHGIIPPPLMYSCNCVNPKQNYCINTTINTPTNTPIYPVPIAVPTGRRGFGYKRPPLPWDNNKQQKVEKSSQEAMEKLFEEFENSKKEEIEKAAHSLNEAFKDAGMLSDETFTKREKELMEKIKLLEYKLFKIQEILENKVK